MQYDTVIIPDCKTLRATTVERLAVFLQQGGRLVVMGNMPEYVDAKPQNGQLEGLLGAQHIPFERNALLTAMEPVREIDIRDSRGARTNHLLTQMRRDGDARWLFVANGREAGNKDVVVPQQLTIRLAGQWKPVLYDTLSGNMVALEARLEGDRTVVERTVYAQDSLLLQLQPGSPEKEGLPVSSIVFQQAEGFIPKVPVELSEPNALLLDMAEYAFDDGEYQPLEEILRIDNRFREQLGYPTRMAAVAQPWVLQPEKPEHTIRLRFDIQSELDVDGVSLALEDAEDAVIHWNGAAVANAIDGWYVDESIKTVRLPKIQAGANTLEICLPFGRRTNLEWCYILGDFGVRVTGFVKTLTKPVRELAFGDIVPQGLPFYGGNILYKLQVTGTGGDVQVHVPAYRGALVGVTLDGERVGSIAFEPYAITLPKLTAGRHEIGLLLFGSRINSFGAVHNSDSTWKWHGPDAWRMTGDRWSYEYVLTKMGILKSPSITQFTD